MDLKFCRMLNMEMHAYLATLYTRFGLKRKKNSEWGEGEWQMKMTMNE
jgi:hypothetical protein